MPIGYTPDLTAINTMIGDAAVGQRDAAARTQRLWSYIQKVGVAGLQADPYNMTEADAQAWYNMANLLWTPAAVYYGLAAQAEAYNFDDALAKVRGGS